MSSAATAPDLFFNPSPGIAYHCAYAADTRSVVWLKDLYHLLSLENENDLVLKPTQGAFQKARTYLTEASKSVILPMPAFSPDGEGGIDIEWENKGRRLALNFSSDG